MAIITLFHGSPYESVTPEYGLGNDKHDYGRGFYLTANVELAKEWAVCRPDESNGWVHQYELDTNGLHILDFQEHSVLTWLAELMKHRDAADSKRYRVLAMFQLPQRQAGNLAAARCLHSVFEPQVSKPLRSAGF